ncbi:MAG: glycine--tRNA ligase subunit beta [Syntrophus sp. (in: bacteria)]|nr:glycine--tRNA ligase subunit beta [Syntrophus sp. (in: bacteria)]
MCRIIRSKKRRAGFPALEEITFEVLCSESRVKTLLLEIGTEEIPARFLEPAKEGLKRLLEDSFAQSRITFGDINIQTTPRRMTVFVSNMAEKQEETTTVKFGPPLNRAYDESGNPTKAALGFTKAQGAEMGELKKGVKDGVEFVTIEKFEKGRGTVKILQEVLPDIITKIPFQKKMRWGAENFEYARPIQWVLCLFGDVPVEFTVADVKSGNVTYCHRFLSSGQIIITDPQKYAEILKTNYIIINEAERMETVRAGIKRIEEETKGHAIRDEELIKEIIYITEYPYPLRGSFDEAFLGIPKEVLVNVMKTHQRYIPIEKDDGQLMPHFIFFANTVPKEDKNVIRGNEKVLRARLADAQFFFEEDKKAQLIDRYERLGSIVFHVKLGTLKDKAERVGSIAAHLASILAPETAAVVAKTTKLMKADLLTHMVGEFPELQGTMGRIYATIEGESSDVARAIEEHYLPTGGNGNLPQTPAGSIVGIADKIDSITSFFSMGMIPTGNLDPYALRRQSLGIIKIIVDKCFRVPLENLIDIAYESGRNIKNRLSLEETKAKILDFITTRFKFSMLDEKHNQDYVESVLPFVSRNIYDGYQRLIALETQKSVEDFERLMIGFRRVFNITKQITDNLIVTPSLFAFDEEKALYSLYESKKEEFFRLMEAQKYSDSLTILVSFKETIDNYFEKVFVMDNDEAIKNNRLGALKLIKDMFLTFADFSKIRIE